MNVDLYLYHLYKILSEYNNNLKVAKLEAIKIFYSAIVENNWVEPREQY